MRSAISAAARGVRAARRRGLDVGERDAIEVDLGLDVLDAAHPGDDLDAGRARAAACARSRRRPRGRSSRARWRGRRPASCGCRTWPRRCSRRARAIDVLHRLVVRTSARPRCAPACRSVCRCVRPSNTPERISTRSASWRGVASLLWPGRRRSRSRWISSTLIGSRGGQPSTTTPTPPPCDSPKVVMRKEPAEAAAHVFTWARSMGQGASPCQHGGSAGITVVYAQRRRPEPVPRRQASDRVRAHARRARASPRSTRCSRMRRRGSTRCEADTRAGELREHAARARGRERASRPCDGRDRAPRVGRDDAGAARGRTTRCSRRSARSTRASRFRRGIYARLQQLAQQRRPRPSSTPRARAS